MWLFEKRGFVSVVAYDPKYDRKKDSPFTKIAKQGGTHLLVRARIKEDLDWLKAVVPSMVVDTDPGADYAYRAVISRKQFKRALAEAVDGITYDSHFKEVARDNSPKVEGRYNAMMSVWTAFSKLQDIRPWSGSTWYGGGSSTGSSSYGGFGLARSTPKPSPSMAPGAKDIEEFLEEYVASNGETTYRNGSGPRTGFKVDDRVIGYSGAGTVIKVEPSKKSGADSVTVKMDEGGRTAKFISNYLMPEDLPVIEDDEPADDERFDMEWLYDRARKILDEGTALADFPEDYLPLMEDDAFELLTRAQEAENYDGGMLSKDRLNEIYDEILWESSSDKERVEIWSDMESVPAKYVQDAVKLFNSLEVSQQSS